MDHTTDDLHIRGAVYDADGRFRGGGVRLRHGVLTDIDDGPASGATIVPGFVDAHCHGGGGVSFSDTTDVGAIAHAIAAHRRAGTTALVASLVSLADPLPHIRALLPFCHSGELAGIHLEGPYLTLAGAQNPAALRPIDTAELSRWLEAGEGWIRTVTIAPELNDVPAAIDLLLAASAIPSWGHTLATGMQARAAITSCTESAARLGVTAPTQSVTHLFNAMPEILHRAPGPAREALAGARRGELACEIIADGHHVNIDLVEDCIDDIDGAVLLVSDALAAAGMPPGPSTLGGLNVEVGDGVCYVAGTSTIAGGATRLADQFGLLARRGRLSIAQLVRATCGTPGRLLRLDESGLTTTFRQGERPSFVVLDEQFHVEAVFWHGRRIVA